jgi:hypothetical protein
MKATLENALAVLGLRERQVLTTELAEAIRQQIEAFPNERFVVIKNLTLNVQINLASGGGAKVEVSN